MSEELANNGTAPAPALREESKTDSRGTSGFGGQRRRARSKTSLFAAGEPLVWLTGGALAACAFMVVGLLILVLAKGLGTFWPSPLVKVELVDGQTFTGEITRDEYFKPSPEQLAAMSDKVRERALAEAAENDGLLRRKLFRTGNYKLTQSHFSWVSACEIEKISEPTWMMLMERLEWGIFVGEPEAFVLAHYL